MDEGGRLRRTREATAAYGWACSGGPGYQCPRPRPGRALRVPAQTRGSLDRGSGHCWWGWLWLASRRDRTRRHFMAFQVAELSLELIEVLAPLMPRIKQRDKSLADQLSRAASSVALNIGEAQLSDPGNRRARLFSAAGSANETLTGLRVAVAWRQDRKSTRLN